VNYITASGAARLRAELERPRRAPGEHAKRIAELREILKTVTIVEAPHELGQSVGFGARVTVRDSAGNERTYRIVGVDELNFHPDAISWISPIGKALLIASLNERVTLDGSESVRVVKIEYPTD
jgi:transcription elongation factor GreB